MCFTISTLTTYEGYARALKSLHCVSLKLYNVINNQLNELITRSNSVILQNLAHKGHDTMYHPRHGNV